MSLVTTQAEMLSLTAGDPGRSFTSDNTAGGAPEIIAAVAAAASGQAPPYGTDSWTLSARRRFSEIFDCDVDLLPVSTGSAANALSLAALTPPWGSVLCHRDISTTTSAAIEESRSKRARTQRSASGRRSEVACM